MDLAWLWKLAYRGLKLLSICWCEKYKILKSRVKQKSSKLVKNYHLVENCIMFGIYDLSISSCYMMGWNQRRVSDEMRVWGDPLGAFWVQHQRLSWEPDSKGTRGWPLQIALPAAAVNLSNNLSLMWLGELSPYIYCVPSMVWKTLSGWSRSRGKHRKIGKRKNRV